MALSDVHKWKHWVKVNSCAPTTLCISAVNTCDFPVVFYPICFKFLSYVAGVEIKIEKVKKKPKIKIQIELPISKLPSLGQQDKKCLKGSQKCVFFPCQISNKPALFKCLDKLDKIKWNNCFVWPHFVVCPDSYTKSELTEFEEKLL